MVIIMALMTAPLSVFATTTKKIVKSGFCGVKGDSVKYTLYNDGTLVISGQGKMKDFAFSQADGIIVPYADNSYNKKYEQFIHIPYITNFIIKLFGLSI